VLAENLLDSCLTSSRPSVPFVFGKILSASRRWCARGYSAAYARRICSFSDGTLFSLRPLTELLARVGRVIEVLFAAFINPLRSSC
jgi:hypothetical protein